MVYRCLYFGGVNNNFFKRNAFIAIAIGVINFIWYLKEVVLPVPEVKEDV